MSDFVKVYGFAKEWVSKRSRPFTSEDIRIAFEAMHPNIIYKDYGNVMISLSKDRLILFNGYVKAIRVGSKCRTIKQWISPYYRKLQQMNRMSKVEPKQIYKEPELEFK